MNLHEFARCMPKAELHVHLEGSIRPATLLQLAQRNDVSLPAQDVEGLGDFYRFRDFAHFIEVYITITSCLRAPDEYRLILVQADNDLPASPVRNDDPTIGIRVDLDQRSD